jgi:F-type H+-transporting ATPase subunit b
MTGLRRRFNRPWFALLVLVLFFLCPLVAARASGGTETADRSGDLWDLLWRIVNFTLLIIILTWALKRAGVKKFFTARTEEIRLKLEELKEQKEASEKKYKELERSLREFEQEKKDIMEQYVKEGRAEKERIIGEAKDRADQILVQAEATIQQEMASAGDRLKQEVVHLASQRALELIEDRMTDKDQDRLVNEFIERLEKVN